MCEGERKKEKRKKGRKKERKNQTEIALFNFLDLVIHQCNSGHSSCNRTVKGFGCKRFVSVLLWLSWSCSYTLCTDGYFELTPSLHVPKPGQSWNCGLCPSVVCRVVFLSSFPPLFHREVFLRVSIPALFLYFLQVNPYLK